MNSEKLKVIAGTWFYFSLFTFSFSLICHAESLKDRFIDPCDGQLDASNWLLNHKGVLPIPLIITEPAIGYGGGAFLMYFHDSLASKASREKMETAAGDQSHQMIPPSISGVGGALTETDTWMGGGFHFASWKEDHIRYLGAAGATSLNLSYYGSDQQKLLKKGVDYTLEGWGTYQELKFRVPDSKLFLGGTFTYFDTQSAFSVGNVPSGIGDWEVDFTNTGVGVLFEYDSRDNIFTPDRGMKTRVTTTSYIGQGGGGGHREFQITDVRNVAYWQLGSWPLVLGWRVSGRFSGGQVPFYALPYVRLRGIPSQRYQGNHVLETEVEARHQVTGRVGLIGFGGVGRAADELNEFGRGKNRWGYGVGIRYLMARVLKLHAGVDIARGPEDWAIYICVGERAVRGGTHGNGHSEYTDCVTPNADRSGGGDRTCRGQGGQRDCHSRPVGSLHCDSMQSCTRMAGTVRGK